MELLIEKKITQGAIMFQFMQSNMEVSVHQVCAK